MHVHFLGEHPIFGRADKPLTPSYQQRSPYYWWWEYLRRNSDYLACCERGGRGKLAGLYKDFGDVRGENFKKWWTEGERGAVLFGEPELNLAMTELASKDEWSEAWTKDAVMVLAIPLNVSKRQLQQRFAVFLRRRHTAKRGRKPLKMAGSRAKYPLHRHSTIENLRKALQVYDLCMENKQAEKKRTLWELGVQLRLVPTAMATKTNLRGERAIDRNVLAATVSRYLRKARAIIENTSNGQFPNH